MTWLRPIPPGRPFHQLDRTDLHRWWRPVVGLVVMLVTAVASTIAFVLCLVVVVWAVTGEWLEFASSGQAIFTDDRANLFALLALVVACLGITNTLVTSVVERTREIGILKAVGASNRQVWGIFLAEGAVIGLAGGLLGLALALGLTVPADAVVREQIEKSTTEKLMTATVVEFPLWLTAATVGFAVGVTTLAAWYPARRAARIEPVEALRHS